MTGYNIENGMPIEYWQHRAKTAEALVRTLIKVNPMVKNLKVVKDSRDEWAKYATLNDQLKVWDDHE